MYDVTRRLWVIIIALILTVFGWVSISVPSFSVNGQPSEPEQAAAVTILEIVDDGIDENNDTSYDVLALNITLRVNTSGRYHVLATMNPSGILEMDNISRYFIEGDYSVELRLSGAGIYDSGKDGPYRIAISVYGKDLLPIAERDDYLSKDYKFEYFNPLPELDPSDVTSIEIINNTIMLKTKIFIAVIYELKPMIEFYYTADDGLTTKFRVSYERVIGFNDENSDGLYQASELRYSGDLLSSRWDSKKVLMENYNSFDFRVRSIVALQDSSGLVTDTWLDISFHYASPTSKEEIQAAQKFDIALKIVGASLPEITHFALEHVLEDLTANHEFVEDAVENKISFITDDGKEHGYYGWHDTVERKTSDSEEGNDIPFKYNLESTENDARKKLYLNYPYSPSTIEIFHDPEVGVNPENLPELPGEPTPEIIRHQMLIYIVVAVIAAVIMAVNFYRQKKKRTP